MYKNQLNLPISRRSFLMGSSIAFGAMALSSIASPGVARAQSVDDFVDSFHSRNGFSRDRMPADSAQRFDDTVRALAERYADSGDLTVKVAARVTWGRPMAPNSAGEGQS